MKLFKRLLSVALLCGVIAFAGCRTAPSALTQSAVKGAVSAATSFGLEQYPQAEPEVRVAESVICAAANSTNVQPSQVVAALQKAGITNDTSRFIINAVLAIYNGVFSSYGNDWIKNQVALQGYLGAMCEGMTEALPPALGAVRTAARKPLPPHLR